MNSQKRVLLACFPFYLYKFPIDDVQNSGVDAIIYVVNIVVIHEPSSYSLTSVCTIVSHTLIVMIKFETRILQGHSVQLITI